MDDETLVKVENVRKKFCRSLKRSIWYGMSDMISEVVGGRDHERLRKNEFWAVNGANFELRRGECLGLIGRNGAGKTTLLKMLNGLIKPDAGRIEMHGRVGGALIALGAGFNPILTGRENAYVNGSVLGLTKREIDAKIEQIIDFAEIGEFIDSPVQSYSSGMHVRLGFAVAVILIQPDILFLDEVLAVGDIGFTIKCLNAVRLLADKAAVIFVSHNMQFVSTFCTRVILMDKGRTSLDASNPADAIDRYNAMVELKEQQSGTGEAKVLALTMYDGHGELLAEGEPRIQHGQTTSVILDLEVRGPRLGAHLHLYIMDEAMVPVVCIPINDQLNATFIATPGRHRLKVPLGPVELSMGKYSFTIAINDAEAKTSLARAQGLRPFRVFAENTHWGKIVRPTRATMHTTNE